MAADEAALSHPQGRTSNQFAVFNDIDSEMDIDIDDLALQIALMTSRAELQRASERSGAGAGGAHTQERPPPYTPTAHDGSGGGLPNVNGISCFANAVLRLLIAHDEFCAYLEDTSGPHSTSEPTPQTKFMQSLRDLIALARNPPTQPCHATLIHRAAVAFLKTSTNGVNGQTVYSQQQQDAANTYHYNLMAQIEANMPPGDFERLFLKDSRAVFLKEM